MYLREAFEFSEVIGVKYNHNKCVNAQGHEVLLSLWGRKKLQKHEHKLYKMAAMKNIKYVD